MDAFDTAILRKLQENSRVSTDELGADIGLSASACQRRIKRLKQEGVIKKEVALLDSEKLTGYLTIIVDVVLEKGGNESLDSFIALLEGEQQVQQIYYVAGESDYVVIVKAKSMGDYDLLSRKIFMSNPNVKKFSSKVAIKANKVGMVLPI